MKVRKRKAKDLFNYCYLHRTQHFHKHTHDDYTLWENGREIDELVMIPNYSIFSSIDEVGLYACKHTRTSYKELQRNKTSFTEELAFAKYYLKDKLAEAFPLMQPRLNSPNLTYYPDLYYLCD